MRPDQITPEIMPTVWSLAQRGVWFRDHHALYPTHTRVNMSSLATGTHPGRHGIVANTMLAPDVTADHIIDTSDVTHLDALTAANGGVLLGATTLAQRLAGVGQRVAVAGGGTPGATLLWSDSERSRLVNPGSAFGIADLYALREKVGPVPARGASVEERSQYLTQAVIDLFLDDRDNRVIVLWNDAPDSSLHRFGLGSPEATAALRSVDASVRTILDALDRRGLRDAFDVLVMSDHGHSTVRAHRTLRQYLQQAAMDVPGLPPLTTASDYVYAAPGSPEPTAAQLAPLVAWLREQPWCDVLLGGTSELSALPGVMPLADVWGGRVHPRRPLLAVSPVWSDAPNEHGVPGDVAALTTQAALRSSHGSLSPWDLHATLIANGPSFRDGVRSMLPTGGIDLLPTLLTLLGLPLHDGHDGRVWWEGMRDPRGEPGEQRTSTLLPERADNRQSAVQIEQVGTATYVHGSRHAIADDTASVSGA